MTVRVVTVADDTSKLYRTCKKCKSLLEYEKSDEKRRHVITHGGMGVDSQFYIECSECGHDVHIPW